LVEQLAEHFDAGAGGLDRGLDADDFDFFANLDDAALDTTGDDRTTTRDREDVFDREEEGLVDGALWRRDVAVERVGQAQDRASPMSLVSPSRALSAEPLTMGMSSPGNSYLESSSRTSISTSSSSSSSSTMSHLLR
jgi:hypothetical protein